MSELMPIESAPSGVEIQARIPGHGDDNLITFIHGAVEGPEGSCGAWVFTSEQEPPDCWTDGYCWAVNADGNPSVRPTHWKPTGDAPSPR